MEIDFLRSFSKDVEDVAPLQSTALYRAVYPEDAMTNFLHEKTLSSTFSINQKASVVIAWRTDSRVNAAA